MSKLSKLEQLLLVFLGISCFASGYLAAKAVVTKENGRVCMAGSVVMIEERFFKCKEIIYNDK